MNVAKSGRLEDLRQEVSIVVSLIKIISKDMLTILVINVS